MKNKALEKVFFLLYNCDRDDIMKITKEEIALYLSAYTNVLTFATINPEKKFTELFYKLYFEGFMPLEPTVENYKKMIHIHCVFCNIKLLSFFKDGFYTGLDEKNLINLYINDIDTLNKICIENYTKKDIILYVRNALAHNDKENPLYWFESDGEDDLKIHILLKKTNASLGENKGKNIPFELVLTPKSLNEITQAVGFASKRSHIFGLNVKNSAAKIINNTPGDLNTILRKMIDEIYYYRNFYKTLSEQEKEKFQKLPAENYIEEYNKLLKSKLTETKTKKLSPIQKNTFYNNILKWKDEPTKIDLNELFDYESSKIIPTGLVKVDGLYLSSLRAISFLIGLSYNESKKMLIEGLCQDKENVFTQCKYLFKADVDNFKERVKLGVLDDDNELNLSFSIYCGYLFDSLLMDEEIVINNKSYSRERIRNSFVHGRWYISSLKWELFDGLKNEFDFDWHKSIDMEKLKLYLEEFLNSKFEKNKKK